MMHELSATIEARLIPNLDTLKPAIADSVRIEGLRFDRRVRIETLHSS